jgi:hypothetical protein
MVGSTLGVYGVGLIFANNIIINRVRHISALGMRSSFSSNMHQTQTQTGRLLKAGLVLWTCGPQVRKRIGSSSASNIITLPPSIVRVAASAIATAIDRQRF